MKALNEIDKYIAGFPKDVQAILLKLRKTIIKAVPNGEEVISYKMPAYKKNGILVWYAAYKNHIGFYPSASPIKIFKEELTDYKTSKGAIQFPLDKPLPVDLIAKIVQFKAKENLEKKNLKRKNAKQS